MNKTNVKNLETGCNKYVKYKNRNITKKLNMSIYK